MTTVYDIAIVGLGPAGATLARLLPPGFNVIAVDQKQAAGEEGFHKPCGGLLAPDAQKALAKMGLNLGKEILVDPQIFSVRTIDLDSGQTRHYQRNYVNLDRHKFDLWLKSLIRPHVRVEHNTVLTSLTRCKAGFCLSLRHGNGAEAQVFAKQVVGADGAKSMVRHFIAPNKKLRQYLAVQEWFLEENPNPFYSCIFDSKNTDCYSWSISKDGYFIFGGAYPVRDGVTRFEAQKEALRRHGFVMGKAVKREACLVLRPRGLRDMVTGRDGVYLIGEAAGFVSPSSLEGMSYAMNSAMLLAKVLEHGGGAAEYHRATAGLRRSLCLKLFKCPVLYQPFLRKLVMKSGLTAIKVGKFSTP